MPVKMTSQTSFAVIQVKGFQVIEAANLYQSVSSFLYSCFGADIITCRKSMTGIEAIAMRLLPTSRE
jgi:hypothetical protein